MPAKAGTEDGELLEGSRCYLWVWCLGELSHHLLISEDPVVRNKSCLSSRFIDLWEFKITLDFI